MKANVEALEGNKVKLSVELDESEVDQAVEQAFKKIARQVNIPGFRPGKAPRKLIEARIGIDAARGQALNDSLPDYYVAAVKEQDIDVIAPPELKIVSGEEEGPVAFEATVDVRPVPELVGYQGLQVTVPNPEPGEADIDAQVERMRAQSGELEDVDRPAKVGDFVTIDIEGVHEGEAVPGLTAGDYSYEVGSGLQSLGEEFDSQVEGSSAGETKTFTSPVPPNDLDVEFTVTIKQVAERKLPDLTDEWANEASEFETVQELRADITKRLAEVRKLEASRALRGAVIEAISELVTDEIPDALVDQEMTRQLQEVSYSLQQQGFGLAQYLEATGQSQEDFVAQLREAAVASVRADLALRSLADKENLQATEEEVDQEVEQLAKRFGQKASKVRRDLERAEQMPAVRSDIRKTKAVRWLMDNVEVVDSDGRKIDRSLLAYDNDELGHEGHNHDDEHDEEVANEGETTV